jgi:hypothetical protein
MNLSDLSEVLRDRAELPDSAHEARMAGVRARVSATRRRRAVAGVACVVLALVGIVYAVLPRPDRSPEPALPTRSLPEYQDGTRLVAQAWGDLPSTSVTVRFVPKTLEFWLFARCDTGGNGSLLMTITINDRPYVEQNTCGSGGGGRRTPDWSKAGVVLGQPNVIKLTVVGKQGESESGPPAVLPLPATGTFALGVGEEVPVNEYPFPPRPQTLENMDSFRLGPAAEPMIELRADPADPAAPKETTVEWPGPSLLLAGMNTPGRIRVLVDDNLFIDVSNWSYGVHSTQAEWPTFGGNDYGISKGQTVKITVIPERTTGDWRVELLPWAPR